MKKIKFTLFAAYLVALVLEILPYGAVCIFDGGTDYRKTYSYFDLTPYGYANFAPLIVAILTVALVILCAVFLFKNKRGLATAITVVTVLACLLSFAPLLLGVSYYSVVGGCISAVLLIASVLSVLSIKSAEH